MDFNINQIVRSVVVGAVALTVTIPLGGVLSSTERGFNIAGDQATEAAVKSEADKLTQEMQDKLTRPCVDYKISKVDSKLERDAKSAIDDFFGGDVNHNAICDWIL